MKYDIITAVELSNYFERSGLMFSCSCINYFSIAVSVLFAVILFLQLPLLEQLITNCNVKFANAPNFV